MFYLLNILIQMKILLNNQTLIKTLRPFSDIGFVPTMGGIHDGHISLIKKSIKSNKKTIVSIFVNPKQFNSIKDFKSYPSSIKDDLTILKRIKKLDYVYIPKFKHIYENNKRSNIKIEKKYKILCAKFRKGHFEGVLDVMNRLTKKIKPKNIFMGEKDFQQFFLVKNFIEKRFDTKIIGCKTIRNRNNLALSSRNFLFKKKELKQVEKISNKFLKLKIKIKKIREINKFLQKSKKEIENFFDIKIEYLENRSIKNLSKSNKYKGSRIFLAYYFKDIRLIDNF
ncbi:pantoate--beta-alanine ligase [Candidatus Pelagibacter sp. HTCC7211]|uniref:pantoate--beta-alanine ligase n=1 Tax=Pelagibacter sp. (strain HTCC7211) TaxID=439493 RepID=UPI000183AC6D|nr:pantoate--beta-alanine ligase [Candidatus Pelagibacter sp. HTCC7211]MBD1150947.1 pantoate--beta-alanine ligase [Pelagibacterales bacterium SAG-MED25]